MNNSSIVQKQVLTVNKVLTSENASGSKSTVNVRFWCRSLTITERGPLLSRAAILHHRAHRLAGLRNGHNTTFFFLVGNKKNCSLYPKLNEVSSRQFIGLFIGILGNEENHQLKQTRWAEGKVASPKKKKKM